MPPLLSVGTLSCMWYIMGCDEVQLWHAYHLVQHTLLPQIQGESSLTKAEEKERCYMHALPHVRTQNMTTLKKQGVCNTIALHTDTGVSYVAQRLQH